MDTRVEHEYDKEREAKLKFKLVYIGEIKINPKKRSKHLHEIRRVLSPQLKRLTEISPYNDVYDKMCKNKKGMREIAGAKFFPIITPELNLLAELDIQIMHPEIIETPRADIDNRMKTLLDALKRPQSANEVVDGLHHRGEPQFTLLDDDHLVTKLTVNTTHLLSSVPREKGLANPDYDLLVIISVTVKASKGTMDNLAVIV